MKIIRSINLMQKAACAVRKSGKTIGFVPTMGALHEGHMSLIRRARKENDCVVVSIFVNPAQFGPKEDFKKYPRPFAADVAKCRQEKVDIIFCPGAHEMYPSGYKTYVEVADLGNYLCGVSRPGHFKGVATVVAKLLNIVRPDAAYFGQKDAQQVAVIQRMVADLNFPLRIKVMPTVREHDGLAMSSRNAYLNREERQQAVALSRALRLARSMVSSGTRDSRTIIAAMSSLIKSQKKAQIDYVAIVDASCLEPVKRIARKALVALAVRFGKTRLIDNSILKP